MEGNWPGATAVYLPRYQPVLVKNIFWQVMPAGTVKVQELFNGRR
jgi:hypothetical protein